ncbi:hypothetical protein TNCV_1959921 [Trichonephila clavipes]|nr:hypothetical protein TNCV_1959921 [Trichonephila clavipes]
MQISPSRVELAARGQNDKKESAGRKAFISITDWLYDGRVHERRESRYDSGVWGHRLQMFGAAQRLYAERHPVRRTLIIPCLLAYTSNYVRPVHSRRQHVIEIGRHVPN